MTCGERQNNSSSLHPKGGGIFVAAVATLCLTVACAFVPAANAADVLPATQPAPRHEYTNVILISLQCLRPDHLGAYGYKRDTSPNIDRLAKGSVLFENAISQANLTPVAQMSVLTSQYPRVNGMVSFEVTKEAVSRRTLPEILKYYGYTTAATVSSPEFFMRFDTESGNIINPGDVFSRSFDYFGRTLRGRGSSVRQLPTESLEWIRQNKDRKFFLWIANGLLHMPYGASVPPRLRTMYDPPGYTPFWQRLPNRPGAAETEGDPSYDVFSRVFANDYYVGFSPVHHLTDDDVKYVNARYDAGVHYTDEFIGALMQLLDSLNLTEKTLVVLQSIHGDDLGEKGNYFHYDVTDAVVKNALITRFPGAAFAGKRVPEQVSGIDIMPTILDYLEIPVNHEAQGRSVLPLLKGDRSSWQEEYVFIDRLPWWEYTLNKWYFEHQRDQGERFSPAEEAQLPAYTRLLRTSLDALGYPPGDIAVRTNDWKLIVRKNPGLQEKVSWQGFITGRKHQVEEMELYDLRNDPQERANVAGKHPEVVARLKKRLLEWDAGVEARKAKFSREEKRWIIPYP